MGAEDPAGKGHGLSRLLFKNRRRRLVLVVWIIILLAIVPMAALSSQYINYSSSGNGVSGSQSQQAQNLLAQGHPQNSTLFAVVANSSAQYPTPQAFCSQAQSFGAALALRNYSHYDYTGSICYSEATLLNEIYGPHRSTIVAAHSSFVNYSAEVYAFPQKFYAEWGNRSYTYAAINTTYIDVGGPYSNYTATFKANLLQNYSTSVAPLSQVNAAIFWSAPPSIPSSGEVGIIVLVSDLQNYTRAYDLETSIGLLLNPAGPIVIAPSVVASFLLPGNGGWNYVLDNGWTDIPFPFEDLFTALRTQYVSPDGTTQILLVIFNVPDSYRGPDNTYPAQIATPGVRTLATEYFGPGAGVTGSGAISYDTQALTSSSDFLFALTFVFLAIAVLITLRSWVAPLLTILFVLIGTLFGDVAIFTTGLLFGQVDYLVTYTLEAVTLGIVTDYLVFLLYRYREEVHQGVDPQLAIERATDTAGFAVLTSAIIVAVGLGVLSFIPGLPSWGPVLFIAVMLIGICEATLLPVLTSYIGPRIFLKKARTPGPTKPIETTGFYRASHFSVRRRYLVIALVAVLAIPAIAVALTVPTTYDVTQGLPSGLPSVQAQQQLDSAFGSNQLYPTYVLVQDPSGYLLPNGQISPAGAAQLNATASHILSFSGVKSAIGPYVSGNRTTSATKSAATTFIFDNGTWAYWAVFTNYNPFTNQAMDLVGQMRSNSSWVVGGVSAASLDQKNQNNIVYPEIEILIVLLIGIVLGFAFRSLSYPIISLTGVYISISVTVVLLYWISTYLLGQSLIYLIPLILFVILLSLGNDYTVFILSRVVEERKLAEKKIAIPRAIAHSGVVVTSLGLILAVSLGSLGLQPISFLEQLGIAFAISLVIDTFIIRLFYFPAMLAVFARK